MPEEKNECRTGMPCGLPKSGNAVRPAEKRERLHEPHDGLLPEMWLESG